MAEKSSSIRLSKITQRIPPYQNLLQPRPQIKNDTNDFITGRRQHLIKIKENNRIHYRWIARRNKLVQRLFSSGWFPRMPIIKVHLYTCGMNNVGTFVCNDDGLRLTERFRASRNANEKPVTDNQRSCCVTERTQVKWNLWQAIKPPSKSLRNHKSWYERRRDGSPRY